METNKKQTALKWLYDYTFKKQMFGTKDKDWDRVLKNESAFEKERKTPMTEQEAIQFYDKFYGKAE